MIVLLLLFSVSDAEKVMTLIIGGVRSMHLTNKSILDNLIVPLDSDVGMCIVDSDNLGSWTDKLAMDTFKKNQQRLFGNRLKFFEVFPNQYDKDVQLTGHSCPSICGDAKEKIHLEMSIANYSKFTRVTGFPDGHLRKFRMQLQLWRNCYRTFESMHFSHEYDLLVRTRPDLEFFERPPPASEIRKELVRANPADPSNVIVIPDTYWLDYVGGLSDRYWIAGRKAAEVSFNSIFAEIVYNDAMVMKYLCQDKILAGYHGNPENVLRVHLAMHGVTVVRKHLGIHLLMSSDGCPRYMNWQKHDKKNAFADYFKGKNNAFYHVDSSKKNTCPEKLY